MHTPKNWTTKFNNKLPFCIKSIIFWLHNCTHRYKQSYYQSKPISKSSQPSHGSSKQRKTTKSTPQSILVISTSTELNVCLDKFLRYCNLFEEYRAGKRKIFPRACDLALVLIFTHQLSSGINTQFIIRQSIMVFLELMTYKFEINLSYNYRSISTYYKEITGMVTNLKSSKGKIYF